MDINIQKRIEILPKRIRENDKVKGAIITALSGVVETKDDIKELIKEMDNRFEAVDKQFAGVQKSIQTIPASIARIECKEGRLLEKAILDVIHENLKHENIDHAKIRKVNLVDPDGKVFWKGYTRDIDVLVEDGNVYALDGKATTSQNEIAHFMQNVKLYEITSGRKTTRLYLVAL